MKSNRIRLAVLPLGLAGVTAIAIATTAGFSATAVVAKPAPDKVAADVQKTLAKGQVEKAVNMAEALVAANPREARYRALLGQAYLKAGRFESAAQSFDDAMKLGDNSARTALSLALAKVGSGKDREAVAILDDWRDAIPAADLGLAYALAGETNRGVAILSEALRGGENTPKIRQNLAYAFALDGRWREARLMAAQDVPADQIDGRISSWAQKAKPEDSRLRVAGLVGAPARADSGMPAALALNADDGQVQLAAETAALRAPVEVAASGGELPAASENSDQLAQYSPVTASAAPPGPDQTFASTFSDTPVAVEAPTSLPSRAAAPKSRPAARSAAAAPRVASAAHRPGLRPRQAAAPVYGKGSSHAVQLGSFSSEQGARRAWGYYAGRNPELRNFKMVITPATVRGKKFWRVAATGLDGRGAGGLCSKVKNRGGVCFAYTTIGRPANAPAYAARVKAKAPVMAANKPKAAPAGPSAARKK